MEKFTYGALEHALAKVFGMPLHVQEGVLRGRLIHLRRLGFGPRGEGRGSRIEYDRDAVYKWLVVLKFEDLGLDPLVAMNLVEGTWEHHIAKIVARANTSTPTSSCRSITRCCSRPGIHRDPVVSHCTADEAVRLIEVAERRSSCGHLQSVGLLAHPERGAKSCSMTLTRSLLRPANPQADRSRCNCPGPKPHRW